MRTGFYAKLALTGMKKNKRFYLPYIMTCVLMVMMAYIVRFLAVTPVFAEMPGAASLQAMLSMGWGIITAFAVIFLFYTNSFIMRRRRREFGLYNILGMDKLNIGRLLMWETLITALVSLALGLGLGVVLSKLAELALANAMKGVVTYTISLSYEAMASTALAFLAIFAFLLLCALVRLRLQDPIAMLQSENVGEKPPKGNWLVALLGLAALAWAYYMAVSIKDPLSALIWFFAAVLMVIVATYLLMISGSVVLCRLLKKNKKYYYKAAHFVSVSSMAYRMKRNGAGLASICILATMVLVMIASTSCLYFGADDALSARYPRDVNASVSFPSAGVMDEEMIGGLRETIAELTEEAGTQPENVLDYRYATVTGLLSEEGVIELDIEAYSAFALDTYDDLYAFYFVPLADYNAMTGDSLALARDEAMIYINRGSFADDALRFSDGTTIKIAGTLDDFIANPGASADITTAVFVVTNDFAAVTTKLEASASYAGFGWEYDFDTELGAAGQIALKDEIDEAGRSLGAEQGAFVFSCESLAENRDDFYGMFGGLLFLGVMLSIVFIMAAVMIIYYKQISEGYEDQARFDIMQKVGMTRRDIRRSINSQLLTVFFLPLVLAGVHLAFAFPLLQKMLLLFNVLNVRLLILTTSVSFLIFAVFYVIVYRFTAGAYYRIVAGRE